MARQPTRTGSVTRRNRTIRRTKGASPRSNKGRNRSCRQDMNTISKHNNNNMKSCRTIIDTLRALCKTAIRATPQAQRQGRVQTRHPLQSPGLGCIGPNSRSITRGNKTPIVNSRRRPQPTGSSPTLAHGVAGVGSGGKNRGGGGARSRVPHGTEHTGVLMGHE